MFTYPARSNVISYLEHFKNYFCFKIYKKLKKGVKIISTPRILDKFQS